MKYCSQFPPKRTPPPREMGVTLLKKKNIDFRRSNKPNYVVSSVVIIPIL